MAERINNGDSRAAIIKARDMFAVVNKFSSLVPKSSFEDENAFCCSTYIQNNKVWNCQHIRRCLLGLWRSFPEIFVLLWLSNIAQWKQWPWQPQLQFQTKNKERGAQSGTCLLAAKSQGVYRQLFERNYPVPQHGAEKRSHLRVCREVAIRMCSFPQRYWGKQFQIRSQTYADIWYTCYLSDAN